jgi:hypothetical protein
MAYSLRSSMSEKQVFVIKTEVEIDEENRVYLDCINDPAIVKFITRLCVGKKLDEIGYLQILNVLLPQILNDAKVQYPNYDVNHSVGTRSFINICQ